MIYDLSGLILAVLFFMIALRIRLKCSTPQKN